VVSFSLIFLFDFHLIVIYVNVIQLCDFYSSPINTHISSRNKFRN